MKTIFSDNSGSQMDVQVDDKNLLSISVGAADTAIWYEWANISLDRNQVKDLISKLQEVEASLSEETVQQGI